MENNIPTIIRRGESHLVEFKPALIARYNPDYRKSNENEKTKDAIAKTICGFLNSDGGTLMIGVEDNGNIKGLQNDFSLSDRTDCKDFFKCKFDDITSYFPASIQSRIKFADFVKIEEKDIFVVRIDPSEKPVFVKKQIPIERKTFYVRRAASTIEISDIEEIIDYCLSNWGTHKE